MERVSKQRNLLEPVHVLHLIHVDKHALGEMNQCVTVAWIDSSGKEVVSLLRKTTKM